MNFLIILADDLGWNDVGFHGSEIFTPNLDNLALQGIKLNNFYVHPICTPTRAALLTGRYPFRYGLQRIIWPWNNRGLSLQEKLLPQVLKENGYSTYAVGKWNLGHFQKRYYPTNRGFEKHYGNYTGCLSHNDHTYYGVHDFHENGKPIYPVGHACDLNTSKACEWIQNHDKNKPFFMYLAYNSPHLPLEPLPFYENSYSKVKDVTRRKYCAMVTHLDDSVGRLVDTMKKTGHYEDTLIWFLSDNGGWTWDNCGGSNFPLKGGKVSCYEGGIRVVSFIHHNNRHISVFNSCSHVTDIFPTLLKLAKINVQNLKLDGVDLSELIFNEQTMPDRILIHELFYDGKNLWASATEDNWKYIERKEVELYDLIKDPYEAKNLALEHPNICNEFKQKILSYTEENYILDPPTQQIFDSSNNGPPKGFVNPKYWGQTRSDSIAILNIKKHKKPFLKLSDKEIYGYDKKWKVDSSI